MIPFSLFCEMKEKSDHQLKKEVFQHQNKAQKHHDELMRIIVKHGIDKSKEHPDFLHHFTSRHDHTEKAKAAQKELDKRNIK